MKYKGEYDNVVAEKSKCDQEISNMNVMLQKSHSDIKELRYKLLEYETNAENSFDKATNQMKLELKNCKDELYSCKVENTELMNEITHLKYCMHKLQRNLLEKTIHVGKDKYEGGNDSTTAASSSDSYSASEHVYKPTSSSFPNDASLRNANSTTLNTKNVEIIDKLQGKYEKYYHLAKKWKTEKEKLEFDLKREEKKQAKLLHVVRIYEEMFNQLNIQLPLHT